MQSRWSPRRVGESRSLVLERDGQTVSVEVVYGPPARDPVPAGIRSLLVSLGFVVFGLWALLTVRTSLAWVVALIGVSWAAGGATGPHLGAWQGAAEHIRIAFALLCTILMLRFFVTFPKPKKVGGSPSARRAIQGVFLLFVAFLVAELVVHPVLYSAYPIVFVILILALLVLCLVAVVHSAVKCTANERRDTGLNLVLIGLVIGILIPIIAPLVATALSLFPEFMRDWMWVLEIAFPASLALAVRRRAQLGDVTVA